MNGDYKARVATLKGNVSEHRLTLTARYECFFEL